MTRSKLGYLAIFLLIISNCSKETGLKQLSVLKIKDLYLSCEELQKEVDYTEKVILQNYMRQKSNNKYKNLALIIASPFTLFTSLLFIDYSTGDEEAINMTLSRLDHLNDLYEKKGCS